MADLAREKRTARYEGAIAYALEMGDHNQRTLAQKGHTTHWGVVPGTPCTGVLSNNDPEWLHEDIYYKGLDLAWEEHVLKCPNEDHDTCGPMEMGTVLIGFKEVHFVQRAWFLIEWDHGKRGWAPDEDAEYSAIVGETYTQVVHSKYVQDCNLCSPCYPGQGDLQQDGKGDYIAYTLPPDVWGDRCPKNVG